MAGCPTTPGGYDSPDPNLRLEAILDAARSPRPETDIPALIEQLQSLDPAARLLAIRALERLTGTTLGYDHAAPAWERARAVGRWAAWADEHGYGSDRNVGPSDPKTVPGSGAAG